MISKKYCQKDIKKITELGTHLHRNYKFYLDDFSNCLVIENKKKLVGFATYSIIYERAEILDIYVDEKYRRKGYASCLLNTIIEECKNSMCVNITLEVNVHNQAALDFYYCFGFKIISKRNHYYNNNQDDAYVMELELK